MNKEFELIVTIVNKGQSDKVVEASREAGAKGGTIIYGRGTYNNGNDAILGISLKAEKDIIFTIVESEQKAKVMKLISERANLNLDGEGLCFSLPINSLTGSKKLNKNLDIKTSTPSPNKIVKDKKLSI